MKSKTTTKTAAKRTKCNYDVLSGLVLAYINKNPGSTLNQLGAHFVGTDEKPAMEGLYKFPNTYQIVTGKHLHKPEL